ncbi:hypothetical protein PABG_11025 [Paracoccidioides brasiliensis Pb03]|uniref:Uncharacterized protein n=1 Tax=Paracoccidioides brasiliensis TaxID=121759 RepID=A0A1D2J5Q1_PARBR|nr:hypothetical protein PABG_11025 [Paracoccidioides brasiliensis Pb03]ODH13487.1 hypothetical protein ACO22_07211 [Paracoccidioides brasiliensis]ODH52478.1 hypothetical protein GX48_01258 [Paracoccidioides brasiliensis]
MRFNNDDIALKGGRPESSRRALQRALHRDSLDWNITRFIVEAGLISMPSTTYCDPVIKAYKSQGRRIMRNIERLFCSTRLQRLE